MKVNDNIFAARYAAKSISSSDIVRFADNRLSESVYSDHYLAIIDEENKTWSALSNHLESAFNEFEITIPKFEEAIWVLVSYHVDSILSREVKPIKGFEALLRDIDNFDLHKDIKEYVGDNIGISKMYGVYHEETFSIEETNIGLFNECIDWQSEYGKRH